MDSTLRQRRLTSNQQAILRCVRNYWETYGYAPGHREIMAETGISSTSVVAYALGMLRQRGYVTMTPGIARSVRLVPDRMEGSTRSVHEILADVLDGKCKMPPQMRVDRPDPDTFNLTWSGKSYSLCLEEQP